MENTVKAETPKVRTPKGEKISAALTGKTWSPERKKRHSDTMREGRELWEKNELDTDGKRKGFRVGRPSKV